MTQWLKLSDEERQNTIAIVASFKGISESAVEKDWWVTLVLRAIFSLPFSQSLLFKGGTSLSKGWDLINRFSEDIDLAMNREVIDKAFKGKIGNRAIERLRLQSYQFVDKEFRNALLDSFAELNLSSDKFTITKDPDGNEPHLLINYQSLYEDPSPYLQPRVKIEVSTRSLMEPWNARLIQSFIGSHFQDQEFMDPVFEVPTVEPKRTFLEKAFLLHEEFLREPNQIRVDRMSRHLYDLEKLMDSEHCNQALQDVNLYKEIITHRSQFNKRGHVDYKTLLHPTIDFIPPPGVIEAFRDDYTKMSESMFQGEVTDFDQLITRLQQLKEQFHQVNQ